MDAEMEAQARPRAMLNEEQLLDLIPLSRTTIYRLEKRGAFPRSTYVSPNRRLWFADEVSAWQREANGRRRGRQSSDSK